MADWIFDLEYCYQEEQNAVDKRRERIEYVLFETQLILAMMFNMVASTRITDWMVVTFCSIFPVLSDNWRVLK